MLLTYVFVCVYRMLRHCVSRRLWTVLPKLNYLKILIVPKA
jgi:hypothetical protein